MKKLTFTLYILTIAFNCNSQEINQTTANLKSGQTQWIKNLNSKNSIDTKLKMIKLKILSDSVYIKNSKRRRVNIELSHGESIHEKLKEEFENSDFECQLLFVLNVREKYGIPLNINPNFDSKKVLRLIQPKDIDSVYTSSDFDTLLLYGTNYCGLIVLHSSNRKLKREIKNVL